jgi:NhaP-type Na+/H+ or K+/H+ antiporter
MAVVFLLLICFYMGEAFVEYYKPKLGHHTTFIVLIGLAMSLIAYFAQENPVTNYQSPEVYFLFFIPFLVFNAGFNMR